MATTMLVVLKFTFFVINLLRWKGKARQDHYHTILVYKLHSQTSLFYELIFPTSCLFKNTSY